MIFACNINVDTILDVLGCIGGVTAAIFCWFWVRPADKKLAEVQAGLARNNESISSVRNAILDSSVRLTEVKYTKLVESCEGVYSAFKSVYNASLWLLKVCSALNDLNEIHSVLKKEHKLDQARIWLDLIVKDEKLIPIKVDDLSTAEIYVPNRVWQLYLAANSLYGSAIMQMGILKNGIDIQPVKLDALSKSITTVMPEFEEPLKRYGTSVYATIMEAIANLLLKEIRKVINKELVNVSDVISVNRQFEEKLQFPPLSKDLAGMMLRQ